MMEDAGIGLLEQEVAKLHMKLGPPPAVLDVAIQGGRAAMPEGII